jgi:malonyl CoA-acyl carrier protein transacylase
MGGDLFDKFPDITALASHVLGYSVKKLCLENPNSLLDETQYTQPIVYTVNALLWMQRKEQGGPAPTYVAGHSLGEYNALLAADVFDFETGLRLVKRRGEVMGRIEGGGMAAVVGITKARVVEVIDYYGLTDIDVANDNSPMQVVLSGHKSAIVAAQQVFETLPEKPIYSILRTSGAFHTKYMASAAEQFASYMLDRRFHFNTPRLPVIANLDARPYRPGQSEQTLIEQITQPVRWTDTVRYLLKNGECDFVEVGVGRVLTSLIEQTKSSQSEGGATATNG